MPRVRRRCRCRPLRFRAPEQSCLFSRPLPVPPLFASSCEARRVGPQPFFCAGRFAVSGDQACTACAAGLYAPFQGMSTCKHHSQPCSIGGLLAYLNAPPVCLPLLWPPSDSMMLCDSAHYWSCNRPVVRCRRVQRPARQLRRGSAAGRPALPALRRRSLLSHPCQHLCAVRTGLGCFHRCESHFLVPAASRTVSRLCLLLFRFRVHALLAS